jgi:hypothetical protein
MEEPANTINFMLAGYGVIFGVMGIYLASLIIRWRNLRQDEEILERVKKKPVKAAQKEKTAQSK